MSDQPRAADKRRRTDSLDCLTVERRRQILRVLADRDSTVTVRTLANDVVAGGRDERPAAVPEAAIERVRLQLYHVDLPKLSAAGLVSWDETSGTVSSREHPVREDPLYEVLLETSDDVRATVLADERDREVLAAVGHGSEPVQRRDIARSLAAAHGESAGDDAVESRAVELHHVSLPKLAEAGLVEYDTETGAVAYTGPRDLLAAILADDPRRVDTGEPDDGKQSVKIP